MLNHSHEGPPQPDLSRERENRSDERRGDNDHEHTHHQQVSPRIAKSGAVEAAHYQRAAEHSAAAVGPPSGAWTSRVEG